ncbi:hypothetical protein [Lysinibacillus telephonicus]|uniref:hypothetical protein n=1 Tax=Lysinibacillus telephonicus TaxID=1714840 RepID=UPI003BA1C702
MFEVVSYVNNDSKFDVEVLCSVSEQELYIINVLEKENNSVCIYMNRPKGNEFDSNDNVELARYHFDTLEFAKLFFDKIKSMSAIQLLIFQQEGKKNTIC